MTLRKIDLMHKMFGTAEGKCGDCSHFCRYHYRNKPYRKCEVYGVTCSEASDWNCSYGACGLFNQETNKHDIIRLVRPEKKNLSRETVQAMRDAGQMTFAELEEE